jgi:hypothetical protein
MPGSATLTTRLSSPTMNQAARASDGECPGIPRMKRTFASSTSIRNY